jgi:hypothetical protein
VGLFGTQPPNNLVSQHIDLLAIQPAYTTIDYVVTSSAMLRIMMNPSATLEWTLTTSELTSSSTLVGDVKDHDEPVSDLRSDIGDLRIDLTVDHRR